MDRKAERETGKRERERVISNFNLFYSRVSFFVSICISLCIHSSEACCCPFWEAYIYSTQCIGKHVWMVWMKESTIWIMISELIACIWMQRYSIQVSVSVRASGCEPFCPCPVMRLGACIHWFVWVFVWDLIFALSHDIQCRPLVTDKESQWD